MSMYSGKCDVYDSIVMIAGDDDIDKVNDIISKSKFFIMTEDGKRHRLAINEFRDLVPYFPYIIAMSVWSNGSGTYIFSSQSFVDSEESERIQWKVNLNLKYYRKCKRQKIPYSADTYVSTQVWSPDDIDREIAKRIEINGEKVDVTDLGIDFYDKYDRKRLAETMSECGYSDWDIQRWVYAGRKYNWRDN